MPIKIKKKAKVDIKLKKNPLIAFKCKGKNKLSLCNNGDAFQQFFYKLFALLSNK